MIRKALERVVLWNRLRNIGNSAIGKMTVLVPVFGYLILFNEHVIRLLQLSAKYFPVERSFAAFAQITDRLFWLYIGLFMVGIGSMLFQLRCPKTVKLFSVASEFVAARDRQSSAEHERLFTECKNSRTRAAKERKLPLNLSTDENVKQMLESFYYIENRSRTFARSAVALLYFGGFIVLGVLSLQAFVRVVGSYLGS